MIAKGQNKIIRFKQEQEWAVIPSNEEVSELRRVNASFDVVKNLLQSNEINDSYQVKNFVSGTKNAKGNILGELTPGAYSHLISHALASSYSWEIDEDSITLKVEESPTSGLYRITRQAGSWLTSNIRSGLVIRLDGTSLDSGTRNNNLFVCSISDLVIDVYVLNKSELVLQDFITGNRCYIAGAVTYAQKTNQIDKSFSFEECYTDIGHYELYSGNKIQSMQINLQSTNEYPTIAFDLVGCDLVRKDSTPYFTSSSRNTNRAVSNKNSAIFIDGQPIGLVTAFNISANRDLGLNNAVGLSTAIAITENMLKVNGSFTVYFTDASLKQRYYDEVACSMSVVLAESNYKASPFVCITLPKVIIKSRSKNDNASSLFDTYEFTAVLGNGSTVESSPVIADPYFDNVSLLLHLDGVDGSTVFTDNSPTPKVVTPVSSAQIKTDHYLFGGASAHFGGAGSSSAAAVASSNDFSLGTGDFTIEISTRYTGGPTGIYDTLFFLGDGSQRIEIRLSDGGFGFALQLNLGAGTTVSDILTVTGQTRTTMQDVWTSIVITRASGTTRVFINGNLSGSTTWAYGIAGTASVRLASNLSGGQLYPGYIDEVRITKGVARYTENFTPPTAAFPDSGTYTYTGPSSNYINTTLSIQDSAAVVDDPFVPPVEPTDPFFDNVSLLMHMDGAHGSTSFIDSSNYNRALTPTTATIQTNVFKFGGAAGTFFAAKVVAADANELRLLDADFTIEFFVYHSGLSNFQGYVAKRDSNDQFGEFAVYQRNGMINFLTSSKGSSWTGIIETAPILSGFTWHHIAAVRHGSSQLLFLDGVQVGSTTISGSLISTNRSLVVGATGSDGSQPLQGQIDELRITKGVARYTANFTPPMAAFPDIGP